MFKLIRLVWKFAPHLAIALCGIGFISGLVTLFGNAPPSAAVPMSIAEVQGTAPDKLPRWLAVSDGYLDWTGARAVVREKKKSGEVVDHERVIVPLVGKGGISSLSHSSTLLLVSFPWDNFLSLFPKEATEFKTQGGISSPLTPYKVSFEPRDASTEFAFGTNNEILEQFKFEGFKAITAVRPGSEPLSKAGGAGIAVTMLVLGGAAFVWLRKQRRAAAVRRIADAASGGFRQGIREAVEQAAHQTLMHQTTGSTQDSAEKRL